MQPLKMVLKLLEAFDRDNIRYCHWKSNKHVLAGMCGETDLDILVDARQSLKVQQLLAVCGYKRFGAPDTMRYPAIEDYIGIDEERGVLEHCHLHYRLTIGEKHLKSYCPPWEELILNSRRLEVDKKIYVADPSVELLLLIVRLALKICVRDCVLALFGRRYFKSEWLAEFHWLKRRADGERVVRLASELLGQKVVRYVESILMAEPTLLQLLAFRRSAMGVLRLYRTYGSMAARFRRWIRELFWLVRGVNKRYLQLPVASGRTIPTGGRIVAFIGCDGSGKSTVSREVERCLSAKLHPLKIYLGSGAGPSSLLRWPMAFIAKRVCRTAKSSAGKGKQSTADNRTVIHDEGIYQCLKAIARKPWALVLALEKRKKIQRAWRARNKGMIVLCDRYPQNQVMGFNDGPLLSHWRQHWFSLFRLLARWEGRCYRWADICPPDLVIRLNVSPEVALRRKGEMWSEEIEKRIEATRSLQFPTTTKVVEISADEPLETVLLQAKLAVWESV